MIVVTVTVVMMTEVVGSDFDRGDGDSGGCVDNDKWK